MPRGVPGKTMAERFDYYTKKTGQAVPTVTMAMFETVHQCAMVKEVELDEEEESEEDRVCVMVNELRKDKGKKKVEIVLPKKTPSKPVDPKPFTAPIIKADPQFRYESPAESTTIVSNIWEHSLEAPVTLTQCELLAVLINLGKKAKEFTSAKKVPLGPNPTYMNLFSHLYEPDADGKTVAIVSDPLRAVRCLLPGENNKTFNAEAVLDNGSSIVAMRRDAWELLSVPVQSDMTIDMESSHGTIERTVGVISNLPVRFGNITVYLQVHVTDHLPCEILLRLPVPKLLTISMVLKN
jgi:hypothetical protein